MEKNMQFSNLLFEYLIQRRLAVSQIVFCKRSADIELTVIAKKREDGVLVVRICISFLVWLMSSRIDGLVLCRYYIQHCFISRPSYSFVSEDAGLDPGIVPTLTRAVRSSSSRLDLIRPYCFIWHGHRAYHVAVLWMRTGFNANQNPGSENHA